MADTAGLISSRESEFQSRDRPKKFLLIPGIAAIDFPSVAVRSKVIEKTAWQMRSGRAFSCVSAGLSPVPGKEHQHGRDTHDGAAGAKTASGDRAALVLPQPFPRNPRTAWVHGRVRR
jgi:hypothetical protein